MGLLDEIRSYTAEQTDSYRQKWSLKNLKRRAKDCAPPLPFEAAISQPYAGLIAEIKLRSPSMGKMVVFDVGKLNKAPSQYNRHPVVKAVSVLTCEKYFGSDLRIFADVRRRVGKPILRKDFIFEEYQVWHSRAIGADAILLMANVVTDPSLFRGLHDLAVGLGMAVLCEAHTEQELSMIPDNATLCGVNCRMFKSDARFLAARFTKLLKHDSSTDLSIFDLINLIPAGMLRVVESGLKPSNIEHVLANYHFNAALVGTSLLQADEPVKTVLDQFSAAFERARDVRAAASRSSVGLTG